MSNHASNPIIRDRAKYAVHNNLGRLILIHLIQVSLILVLTLIPIFLFAQDVVDAFSVASTYSDTFIKSYPLAFLTSLKPFFQMMGVLLLEFALFAPCLVAGYQKALIDMARGGRPSVGTLFCRFRNFFGCIGLDLWISLKLLLWALPAFGMTIVGFIIGILAKADWLIAILPFLWMIAAFALLIPASYRYSMASCFYADDRRSEPQQGHDALPQMAAVQADLPVPPAFEPHQRVLRHDLRRSVLIRFIGRIDPLPHHRHCSDRLHTLPRYAHRNVERLLLRGVPHLPRISV